MAGGGAPFALFNPRICRPCAHRRNWLAYTDSATSHPRICALRFRGSDSTPHQAAQHSTAVPTVWLYQFRQTCLIFGLELLTLVAFLQDEAAGLAGCSIWVYMDGNNSLSAMTRGDSNMASIASLVARAWELIQRHHLRAWCSRVPLKLNPADLPTRGQMLPYKPARQSRFARLARLYRLCRAEARVPAPPPREAQRRTDVRPRRATRRKYLHQWKNS